MKDKNIDELMNKMPPEWKNRWCESPCCGCMGCANRSGGYSRQEWKDYLKRNNNA